MATNPLIQADWLRPAIDFLFPPLCLGCSDFHEGDLDICNTCLNRIDKREHPVCLTCLGGLENSVECDICGDDAFPLLAYGEYVGPLKEVIISLKFRGLKSPAALFAQKAAEQFADAIAALKPQALVPIPLHPTREYFRGYNQAALFARELAGQLDLECDMSLIQRIKRRRPQSRMNLRSRTRNIQGVFSATSQSNEPRRLLLVDDVVTSGATIREVRRVLTGAGHTVVGVLAIAHVEGHNA
ncbi:MAG: ComF family protein [Candidatus Zixiibacteriota bacterium]|nr:MAG: ComF family protein [candidate division Zixibacteria bacterium]